MREETESARKYVVSESLISSVMLRSIEEAENKCIIAIKEGKRRYAEQLDDPDLPLLMPFVSNF